MKYTAASNHELKAGVAAMNWDDGAARRPIPEPIVTAIDASPMPTARLQDLVAQLFSVLECR